MQFYTNKNSEGMCSGRNGNLERDIFLDGEPLKIVNSFKYLWSEITQDGSMTNEISRRLQKASRFYQAVRHLVLDRKAPEKAKIIVFESYYLLILTYKAETWKMAKRDWSRIQAGEMNFLRAIKDKTRRYRLRNTNFRDELNKMF